MPASSLVSSNPSWRWLAHVFSIELKKVFSYRLAFWVQFLFGAATDLFVAYFLWRAVYGFGETPVIQGFSFQTMLYYSLFASFAMRIARGTERGYISDEIYNGGLTKYLLYPVSYLGFKFMTHASNQALSIAQLAIVFGILSLLVGTPDGSNFSAASFAAGLLTSLLAGVLHFYIGICIEMVAFWQDVVWNLIAMLRFGSALLGGALVPIAMFPKWGQALVGLTPFPLVISLPARTFLGQVGFNEWCFSIVQLGLWSFVFYGLARWIWGRGLKQYSGVGI